jgi:hypothetical protein
MLSPICWAAAFSAALTFRRALRRGPLAGTGAVPGGGAGGGGGGDIRRVETGRSWARWGLRVGELKPLLAILGDGAPAVRTSKLCCNAHESLHSKLLSSVNCCLVE